MPFCKNCGYQLETNMNFCPSCHNRVSGFAQTEPQPVYTQTPVNNHKYDNQIADWEKQMKSAKFSQYLVFAVVVVAAIFVVCLLFDIQPVARGIINAYGIDPTNEEKLKIFRGLASVVIFFVGVIPMVIYALFLEIKGKGLREKIAMAKDNN